ncbi:hypothetical protein CC86DRAFT_377993 [Ophiobolus disseminans]|uniref:Uncharacterized protein n=1 Tax=Ophiobolus disseminans TaxID=1469910 RepID=A0A6A7ACW4_9PLEO|nr:hypothetical protein CC86DRAFT_377993 [Ophiobolus disseminans]
MSSVAELEGAEFAKSKVVPQSTMAVRREADKKRGQSRARFFNSPASCFLVCTLMVSSTLTRDTTIPLFQDSRARASFRASPHSCNSTPRPQWSNLRCKSYSSGRCSSGHGIDPDGDGFLTSNHHFLSLLQVNRAIAIETALLPYSSNTFYFGSTYSIPEFLYARTQRQIKAIRTLALRTYGVESMETDCWNGTKITQQSLSDPGRLPGVAKRLWQWAVVENGRSAYRTASSWSTVVKEIMRACQE